MSLKRCLMNGRPMKALSAGADTAVTGAVILSPCLDSDDTQPLIASQFALPVDPEWNK
jgi:hypothetical protein